MGQSTDHVRCITDDVLLLARVESSEFNLVFSPLSVSEDIVLMSFQQLNRLAASRGISIGVDVSEDIPRLLLGVSNRLRQVLMNILGNGELKSCVAFAWRKLFIISGRNLLCSHQVRA
jgi:signal transduction histidine kinase